MLEKKFDEFDLPSPEEWNEVAVASLKGKPLEKLEKTNYDDFKTKLIYHNLEIVNNIKSPGTKFAGNDFDFSSYSIIDSSNLSSIANNSIAEITFSLLDFSKIDTDKKLLFVLNADSNLFVNISKIRALRKLLNAVRNELDNDLFFEIYLRSSYLNKSILDKENNILRIANECFSSIIGGADYFAPINFELMESSFGDRISENIYHLLNDESLLNHVNDPSAGSYYIEEMTEFLAEKSWDLFLELQDKDSGQVISTLQKLIQENNQKIKNDHYSGKEKLVGVNVFPNSLNEFKAVDIDKFRLSSEFEQFLKNKEETPTALTLVSIGDYKKLKPRIDFISDFFKVGCFQVKEYHDFENLEDILNTVSIELPKVLILCAEDQVYKEITPDINSSLSKLSEDSEIIIAGYPKDDIEFLKSHGVNRFIHMKSNVLEELKDTWRHFENNK